MKYSTFCAANSGDGFISFFNEIIDEKAFKVFYLKGGPGCGKSTLLKEIASLGESAEIIYCSGDPASLDGVILPEQRTVIIDATSPHSHEPKYPAIRGNIVDLGIGWDPDKMDENEIIRLSDKKSEIYSTCYNILKGLKTIHKGIFYQLNKQYDSQKLNITIDKLLRQNALWEPRNNTAKVQKRFLSAISPAGLSTLTETFETLGSNIILLEDRWLAGDRFLKLLDSTLTVNGIDHINGYHPLLGKETLQHIIIPEASLSVVTKDGLFNLDIPEEKIIKKISVQNFLNKDFISNNKNQLHFFKKLIFETLHLTTLKLDSARELHFLIEKEYAKGMDFEATKNLKEKLINNIFGQT